MVNIAAFLRFRDERRFTSWDGHVATTHIAASEANIRTMIDELVALGANPSEEAVRNVVDICVQRFNELDDGWICTIERDDIYEQIGCVIDSCDFEIDEDWLNERDW